MKGAGKSPEIVRFQDFFPAPCRGAFALPRSGKAGLRGTQPPSDDGEMLAFESQASRASSLSTDPAAGRARRVACQFGASAENCHKKTPFGETAINKETLIADKYLAGNNGYETGLALLHPMGLTTQIPAERVFAANKAANCLMQTTCIT